MVVVDVVDVVVVISGGQGVVVVGVSGGHGVVVGGCVIGGCVGVVAVGGVFGGFVVVVVVVPPFGGGVVVGGTGGSHIHGCTHVWWKKLNFVPGAHDRLSKRS